MAAGPFTWFNQALIKITNGTMPLSGTGYNVALTLTAQPLTAAFNGTSGDCRYSDLTSQTANGNGYTTGGLALTGESLTRTTNVVKWTADAMNWTITGAGITCRYAVIYDNSATNKDLLCFCDLDPLAAGDLTVIAGPLIITPDGNGILRWTT
jgi:hypothetical protein